MPFKRALGVALTIDGFYSLIRTTIDVGPNALAFVWTALLYIGAVGMPALLLPGIAAAIYEDKLKELQSSPAEWQRLNAASERAVWILMPIGGLVGLVFGTRWANDDLAGRHITPQTFRDDALGTGIAVRVFGLVLIAIAVMLIVDYRRSAAKGEVQAEGHESSN